MQFRFYRYIIKIFIGLFNLADMFITIGIILYFNNTFKKGINVKYQLILIIIFLNSCGTIRKQAKY